MPLAPDANRSPRDLEVFREALHTYHDLLRANTSRLDVVNVYPVPDYDTGSNMSQTMADALRHLDPEPTWSALAPSVARGALMGARGNGGVILSQALRGLVNALAGGGDVHEALSECSAMAKDAVMRPVPGTILSVLEAAADGARSGTNLTSVQQLLAAIRHADQRLRVTHRELTLLKDAVVIDAGGLGIILLLDAWARSVTGRAPPRRHGVIMRGTDPDWRNLGAAMCNRLDNLSDAIRGNFEIPSAQLTLEMTELVTLAVSVRTKIAVDTLNDAGDVRILALRTRQACEALKSDEVAAPYEVVQRARAALAQSLIVLEGAA